jgi:hypothetical protein
MNRENGGFIQKWVGWTRENGQHDNGYIAQLLIDNGPLGMSWQMTVAKVYGRVTWRLVIGGKSRQKGLFISEGLGYCQPGLAAVMGCDTTPGASGTSGLSGG